MVDILLKLRRIPGLIFGEVPMILRYDLKSGAIQDGRGGNDREHPAVDGQAALAPVSRRPSAFRCASTAESKVAPAVSHCTSHQ